MPPIFMTLIILVLVVAVAVWLIGLIPFPAPLAMLRWLLIAIVCVLALFKILPLI